MENDISVGMCSEDGLHEESSALEIKNDEKPVVSMILLAYNHLDNTRQCVSSLYKYISHINFELIAVNNGSSDGTREFFESLEGRIKSIHYAVNQGGDIPFNHALELVEGKYTVFISNDLIFTPGWLDNLLTCIESDPKIGMVVPVSSFSSNYQQVKLPYSNIEELHHAALSYNKSDSRKWEDKVRLITYMFLMRTDLLKAVGGIDAIYHPGGFEDDDLSFKVRRAGYRLILARDTFIHHYGSLTMQGDYAKSRLLERNRSFFRSRFGVDAWGDTAIDWQMVNLMDYNNQGKVDLLGITLSCGATLLQIKNVFREKGKEDVNLYYSTEDERYYPDLKSISLQTVCGKAGDIASGFNGQLFDVIVIENDLQRFENPDIVLEGAKALLKQGGQLLFSFLNEMFYNNIRDRINGKFPIVDKRPGFSCFHAQSLGELLEYKGFEDICIYNVMEPLDDEGEEFVEELSLAPGIENEETAQRLLKTSRFIFTAKVGKQYRNVLLYPGYDALLKNRVFEDRHLGNFLGVDTGKSCVQVLRDELLAKGYRLRTIDRGELDDAAAILFFDGSKSFGNPFFREMYQEVCQGEYYLQRCRNRKSGTPLILILLEPPFVMPENYDPDLHRSFDYVFTYCDDLVDHRKYFKYFYSQPEKMENPYRKSFSEKKLWSLVASNKDSATANELYSERRRAIDFFERFHPLQSEFYGKGWEGSGYKTYKGEIGNKLETLAAYKFCICYENGILNGYITEKIFDCFFAGCIPVYLGAPNITAYVPEGTFIDRRRFEGYDSLYEYLEGMGEEEYNVYLLKIEEFLASEKYKEFTHKSFAESVLKVLQNE